MANKRTATDPFRITKTAKHQVTTATARKWQMQYDHEFQSLTWLKYNVDDQDKMLVKVLQCSKCTKSDSCICGMKNYSSVWIIGSTNQRASNITDHVASEQHKVAMMHLRTAQAKAANMPITEHSPIAKSLLAMKKLMQERLEKKVDICYVMAKENIAFRKHPVLHHP